MASYTRTQLKLFSERERGEKDPEFSLIKISLILNHIYRFSALLVRAIEVVRNSVLDLSFVTINWNNKNKGSLLR